MKVRALFYNITRKQEVCNAMEWWDYVLTIVSVGCTFFSIRGAYKSNIYYKKSKQLTIYANINSAYIETQKIIATLTELLKLGGSIKKRGVNCLKEVIEHGVIIKKSITKIRESLNVQDYNDINELINSQEIKVEEYIDSIITGAKVTEERFIIDADFNLCQQKFNEIQLLIKKKLEDVSEQIK